MILRHPPGLMHMKGGLPLAGVLLAASAAGCATVGAGSEPVATVTVEAGRHDRNNTPVDFALPAGARGKDFLLADGDGPPVAVQVGEGGRGTFVLDRLAAGSTRRYALLRGSAPGAAEVSASRTDGGVAFRVAGRPVFRYNAEITPLPRAGINPIYERGGYIHPVHTPGGAIVSADYPPDHLHHHGIWAAWTRTRFHGHDVDFWNVADRKGDVLPVALDSAWSGPVYGGFSARHRYVALAGGAPRDALNERWTARVYNVQGAERPYWIFDLETVQTTASSLPLVLPEYHYGGMAFRGRDEWNGARNATFLTAEGKTRPEANATRTRWTHIGGAVGAGTAGLAMLSHPENFRFPEPVRIHPTEPYFVYAPSQLGEWSIEPGRGYRARYRFVVHDGEADARELDRLWADFADPPRVMVEW